MEKKILYMFICKHHYERFKLFIFEAILKSKCHRILISQGTCLPLISLTR